MVSKKRGALVMGIKTFFTKEETPNNKDCKEKNKGYLRQLQKFLDAADNIEREDLKKAVISEMLKCDKILTDLAQEQIKKVSSKNLNNE